VTYATPTLLRTAYGTQELIDAAATRDGSRAASVEVVDLVIDAASTVSYGDDEVAAATAVVAHISQACLQADSRIDSALLARWPGVAVPVVPVPSDVERVALWVARYFAHSDVSKEGVIATRYRDALAELADLVKGRTTMGVTPPASGGGSVDPVISAPEETFTASTLGLMP
jgi:phage gp36-like protein